MANVKKKSKVVMLPTEKANNALKGYLDGSLLFNYQKEYKTLDAEKGFNGYYHLYILSNEEIKEGDWYLSNEALRKTDEPIWIVRKCDKITNGWLESNSNPGQGDNPEWSKKIIATTDEDLGCEVNNKVLVGFLPLPQPSKQFIEKFIESYNSGNIITEVMVEYEGGCENYKRGDCEKPCDNPFCRESIKKSNFKKKIILLQYLNVRIVGVRKRL